MDPTSCHYTFLTIFLQPTAGIINSSFFDISFVIQTVVLIALLFISGFVSGAETAFFAITPAQLVHLKNSKITAGKIVYQLLNKPKRLLATLLIGVNFVNIAIIVLSSVIITEVFNFKGHETAGFIIQVVAVTFVIIVFCEVLPKVYATQNALRTTHQSAIIIFILDKILRPVSSYPFCFIRRSTNEVELTSNELTGRRILSRIKIMIAL